MTEQIPLTSHIFSTLFYGGLTYKVSLVGLVAKTIKLVLAAQQLPFILVDFVAMFRLARSRFQVAYRDHTVFFTFLCSLLWIFIVSEGRETDITCLKSIKSALEDPYGFLGSWDFNTMSEGFICMFSGVDCWHPGENRVMNIRLSDMRLKGGFPQGLKNCTSLTGLDLSRNDLDGPIPSDISMFLPYATSLDLSYNSFSGQIPASVASLKYLNVLLLKNNRLTGHIPQEISLLDRIKTFSVANNLLSGPVPTFVSVSVDSFANNSGLCGRPLERCKDHSKTWNFDHSFKGGFVIGYVVFAVSVAVILVSYGVPWVKVEKRNEMITIAEMILLMIKKKNNRRVDNQLDSSPVQEHRNEISLFEKIVTRMSFMDLSKATENFSQSNIVGDGQMGTMYKARLPNGWFLAVKRLHTSQHCKERFASELKTLGRLRHDNLLPLIGFCEESNERLLVYKYMPNGRLFDWLHSVEGEKKKMLKWPSRVRIAVGLAKALSWLHHGRSFLVVHLNISSKSILLDQNFEPKLSNFGKAVLIINNPNDDQTDLSRGINFKADSGIWKWELVKTDVFFFGIVLLELITGKQYGASNSFDGSLTKWIRDVSTAYSSSCLHDAIDESLVGQGFDAEIYQLLRVACDCVQRVPERRPMMPEVYKTVTRIGAR